MFIEKKYYSEFKEIENKEHEIEEMAQELLSEQATKLLEKYNKEKFDGIREKVDSKKQRDIDVKLQERFNKISEIAINVAEQMLLDIVVESDEVEAQIRFISSLFIISGVISEDLKDNVLRLLDESDSVQITMNDNKIEIILNYSFLESEENNCQTE